MQTKSAPKDAVNSRGQYTIGAVRSAKNPQITPYTMTWEDFTKSLEHPAIRSTKDGDGLVLAEFGTPYRQASNVISISALGYDVDGKATAPMPPAAAHEWLAGKGWRHVVYTTWSHAHGAPRYRLILALDRPLSTEALRDGQEFIASLMPDGIKLALDHSCLGDAARLYFAPACPPERAQEFQFYAGGSVPLCASR